MYGTQTLWNLMTTAFGFENDVKMYGTQTVSPDPSNHRAFENDVKCMVLKQQFSDEDFTGGLRMM